MSRITWKGFVDDVQYGGKCSDQQVEVFIDIILRIVKQTPSFASRATFNLADLSYGKEKNIQGFTLDIFRTLSSATKQKWKCVFSNEEGFNSFTAYAVIEKN